MYSINDRALSDGRHPTAMRCRRLVNHRVDSTTSIRYIRSTTSTQEYTAQRECCIRRATASARPTAGRKFVSAPQISRQTRLLLLHCSFHVVCRCAVQFTSRIQIAHFRRICRDLLLFNCSTNWRNRQARAVHAMRCARIERNGSANTFASTNAAFYY